MDHWNRKIKLYKFVMGYLVQNLNPLVVISRLVRQDTTGRGGTKRDTVEIVPEFA